jgi:hypothetical protein
MNISTLLVPGAGIEPARLAAGDLDEMGTTALK